ncbi:hypothetical protein BDN72DRAFT_855195 [Pluteus cervinus]|uniref:Uncharacterized protein n=1 Tax=Pluteus cervinus TaxID=181527 RepID=A0ACD3B4J7_9AGAR|nr:hypothetical protein BDN72DRAFT_855195 [Pluteus cervinus]
MYVDMDMIWRQLGRDKITTKQQKETEKIPTQTRHAVIAPWALVFRQVLTVKVGLSVYFGMGLASFKLASSVWIWDPGERSRGNVEEPMTQLRARVCRLARPANGWIHHDASRADATGRSGCYGSKNPIRVVLEMGSRGAKDPDPRALVKKRELSEEEDMQSCGGEYQHKTKRKDDDEEGGTKRHKKNSNSSTKRLQEHSTLK